MGDETLLLNPGPVVLHPSIREALSKPMVSHRSTAFSELYERVRDGVHHIYTNSRVDGETSTWEGEVLFMNATATLGMDAAVANFTDSDSQVLALINGNFGRRFSQIADRQCTVDEYEIPWGESFDVDAVRSVIHEGDYDLVTAIHTETSTGMRNPIGAIGEAVADTDALFVVDGVSSIGGERIHPGEWGIDVSVVDAQKAMAASPGVCAMFLSDAAIDRLSPDQTYFYADLHRHLERAVEQHQTPFTSAVSLFYALDAGVGRILDMGVDEWLTAHEHRARAWEETAAALGLDLFANPTGESDFANTVTAIELPTAVQEDPDPFFATLREQSVFVGGGHGHLAGQIFRLGTMGHLTPTDMDRGVEALGTAFDACGVSVDTSGARETLAAALEQ